MPWSSWVVSFQGGRIWAFSDQQVVRDGCFTRRIRKKKPAAEKVQAKTGRPAAKKSKAAPAK